MYEIGEAEVEAVRRVLLSRKLFRYQSGDGGECDRFERQFAAHLGVGHSLLVTSGTNALLAALLAHGIGEGDEVLVPAYTFVATAAAVRLAGARAVIVNIDDRLGIDVSEARTRITSRTRAIIPVHMDGLSADLEGVCNLAREHNLLVVEDCAQSIGGSFRGRPLGAWGQAAAFSLNQNKNIACGEGGIVATSDPTVYERLFALQDLSARFSPIKKSLFTESNALLGMSMRVSEITGAIMCEHLKRLGGILSGLRERKALFREVLAGHGGVRMVDGHCPEGDCASSVHLRLEDPVRAAMASKRLMQERIQAFMPTLRPAHVAWTWIDLVDPQNAVATRQGLLSSMDIITSILKYDIDLSLDLDETRIVAEKIRALL